MASACSCDCLTYTGVCDERAFDFLRRLFQGDCTAPRFFCVSILQNPRARTCIFPCFCAFRTTRLPAAFTHGFSSLPVAFTDNFPYLVPPPLSRVSRRFNELWAFRSLTPDALSGFLLPDAFSELNRSRSFVEKTRCSKLH